MRKYALYGVLTIFLALSAFALGILGAEVRSKFQKGTQEITQTLEKTPVKETASSIEKEDNKNVSPNSPTEAAPVEVKENNQTENNSFTFAVVGDSQEFNPANPNGAFQKIVKNIRSANPNLVFAIGDLVSSCDGTIKCEEKYNSWKKALGDLVAKTYVIQGNHDRVGREKADAVWQKEFNMPTNGPEGFSKFAYSFDYGNSHFVILDSEKPKEGIINDAQREWLEQDLSNNQKTNTFVFFHEPAFPTSSKIGESLDRYEKDRDALWEILARHQVTAVFSGHEHIFSRKNINGIYQFIVGNSDIYAHEMPKSGVAEYAYAGRHYVLVSVNGNKINVRVFSEDNKLLNSFDFQK